MKLWARRGKPVRIETERFILTTTSRLDAARQSYRWTSDTEFMNPMGYEANLPFRKWRRAFVRSDNRRRFCFAIRPITENRLIGFEQIVVDDDANAELRVAIGDHSWWGKGVVNETRTALLDFAFGPLGCQRAVGYVYANNYPSVANYHKLGFQCEGVLRKVRRNPNGDGRIDMIVFSMLVDEWRQRLVDSSA